MSPTDAMGPFEAFYVSAWQHPGLLWFANALGLGLILTHRGSAAPSAIRWALMWVGISAIDAWLSANHVFGLGALPGFAASIIPFCLVLLGDVRVLWAADHAARHGDDSGQAPALALLPRAVAFGFLAPIVSWLATNPLRLVWPAHWDGLRTLFLTYELTFFGLVLVRRAGAWSHSPAAVRMANMAMLYYGLWITADLVILNSSGGLRDAGFALRVVPNVLYYGFCVPVLFAGLRRP
jgi:hypothetical protein